MAYPPLRSMNAELLRGGSMDGTVKQLRPDASTTDGEVNYAAKRELSLPYYGFGEPRMVNVAGTPGLVPVPFFTENKFEQAEDGPTFGKTW